jgi:hypothetical protein
MKLRTILAVIGCAALIGGAVTIWHFASAAHKLAKQVTACRLGAERGDAESESKLGSMYYYGR